MAVLSTRHFFSRISLLPVLGFMCLTGIACDAVIPPAPEKPTPSAGSTLAGSRLAPRSNPTEPATPGSPDDAPAPPDKDGEYFECRALPELGEIIFTDNSVRGAKPVQYMKEHASKLAEKGMYVCADESKRRVYHNSEKIGDRSIESAIIIDPPTRKGDNGDYFTGRLLVNVNGRRKIDCTIGTTADGELWVSKVVIHVDDGTVEIHALSGDGTEMNVPEAQESLDDPRIITDQSFYDDDPDTAAGPVKV